MKKLPPSTKMEKDFLSEAETQRHPLSEWVRRGAQLLLQRGLELEVTAFLGRAPYQRRQAEQAGYRNGYEPARVMTGEGPLTVHKPQVREVDEPFQSQILTAFTRRSERLDALMPELYVRGLSQEDISQTLREKLGLEKVSPSVVSRVSQKLVEDFRRWHRRSLTIHSILYLFLDAFYLGLRPGGKRKTGILVAYGITREGKKILLDLTVGERESYEAWRVFLDDLKERGLNEPLLVVVDGNAGLLRAVRECWPSSLRQRCQVHKMRNVLAKLPRRVQGEMKGMIQRVFTADSYESALRRGKELIARYQGIFPEAMACLEKDLEECLTCLRFPAEHRPRIRTTNLLERLLGEGRRRTKVIPHFWGERSCLTLVYATLVAAAKKWRGVRLTPAIQQQLAELRAQYQPAVSEVVA